jgi:hypothetical protein
VNCELCNLDLLFYGAPSRHIEGLNICLGCYLQLHNSAYGAPDVRVLRYRFIRQEPRDSRWVRAITAA